MKITKNIRTIEAIIDSVNIEVNFGRINEYKKVGDTINSLTKEFKQAYKNLCFSTTPNNSFDCEVELSNILLRAAAIGVVIVE